MSHLVYTSGTTSIPIEYYTTAGVCLERYLVVLAVVFTLCVQDSRPVVGFEVELGVHINLHINCFSALPDGVSGDTDGRESSANELSNSGWAPRSDNVSSLQGELGSKYGILDSSIVIDLTERKGLIDRRALVSKSIDSSLGIDGNANSESGSDARSGLSRLGKILNIDARNVLKLRLEFGHAKCGAGNLKPKR